jgi:serine/threonine protein kinase
MCYYEKVGDYTLIERLGEGACGVVYLAVNERLQERFAIKVVPIGALSGMEKLIQHEASIMQGLSHPHVVKLRKLLQDSRNIYLIMELVDGGELFDLIIQSKVFDESTARKYFQQLISAIFYCHSQKVAHRDLKAENLLLDKFGNLKVCDFGFSFRHSEDDDSGRVYECGTLHYMSPEMLSHHDEIDVFQQDLWAAGVILYFMLAGKLPFDGRDDEETVHLIQSCCCDWSGIPTSAIDFMRGILRRDSLERMTLEQTVEHPWFQVDLQQSLFPAQQLVRKSSRSFLDFALFDGSGKLTEGEDQVIRKAFACIDVDGDGEISSDELRDSLIRLKKCCVESQDVERLMKSFNTEGKLVTLEQFRDAWVKKDLAHNLLSDQEDFQLDKIISVAKATVEKPLVRELRRAFDEIDKTHSGRISRDLLFQFFEQAHESVKPSELDELMNFFAFSNKLEGITFDDFCDGVAKRDVLLKHPLGQKLARFAGLEHLIHSQELSRCMGRGFIVSGERQAIVDKIVFASTKFSLLTTKQDAQGTDCVYTFRLSGGHNSHSSSPSANRRRVSEGDVSPTKQHSYSLFDVVLTRTSHPGYVCVSMRRISGPTTDYHEAVTILTQILSEERFQAVLDSCPQGEPELL